MDVYIFWENSYILEDFTFQSFCKCLSNSKLSLTLKLLGIIFCKDVSPKERVKPCFFLAFNIAISYIFSKNFSWIPPVVPKIWIWIFLSIFIIFCIFWHFLVTKKLMTSAYNKWCQHFFHSQHTLKGLFKDCIKLY